MKWCEKCLLPDTRPGVVFNSDGVCGACDFTKQNHKRIDWTNRERDFISLIENVKKKVARFDCLIPVSGGKDSTWQVVKCLEYGLRPLAVTWKTPVRTDIGQRNLDNLVNLGVDHIDWQVNPEVEKKLLVKAYKRYGATGIPMHMALFNMPLTIAFKFNIPLVIFGENSAIEYGSGGDDVLTGNCLDSNWLSKFGVTHGTTAKDWIDEDLSEKDLSSYFGPTDEELNERKIHAIFLGHYFKWDVETSLKVARENGFEVDNKPRTGIYNYADIDDDFISIHHWLKWYKFGMTRSFDNLSIEIRKKRLTKKQAIEIIIDKGDERPVDDIHKFCQFTGLKEADFYSIAETYRNKDIWYQDSNTWKIKNFLIENWNWD